MLSGAGLKYASHIKHLVDETLNGGAKEGLPWIHVTSHPYSDFLTPPSLFSSPCSLSCLTFLASSTLPHQMPEHESGARHSVMSNLLLVSLSLYLSLSVSLYLPSFLNQETRAKPTACQRTTLPVCVPASGHWLSAWRWLWSWLSMPYRSARRGEKRSSTHELIPKAEGVIYETDIKKAGSLGS